MMLILSSSAIGQDFTPIEASGAMQKINPLDSSPSPEFMFSAKQLNNQESRPFLVMGRPMDSNNPRWNEYRDSIQEFKNAKACLVSPPIDVNEWNVIDVKWASLKNHRDIEVCFFRIFDTLNDPHLIREWLLFQDYGIFEIQSIYEKNPVVQHALEPRYYFEGLISKVSMESRVSFEARGAVSKLINSVLPQPDGYVISVSFSKNMHVVSIFSGSKGN